MLKKYIIIKKLYKIKYIKDFQRMTTQICMKCKQKRYPYQFQKCFCLQRICNKCNSTGYCGTCNQPFRAITKQQKGYDKIGIRKEQILISKEFKTQKNYTYLKKNEYDRNQAKRNQVKPTRQTPIRNLTQTKTQQKLNQGYLQKYYNKDQYSRNQYIQVISKRKQQIQPTVNQLPKPTNHTRQNQIFRQERNNRLLDQIHQRQRQKKKIKNQTQTYEQQLAETKRNISLSQKYYDKKCFKYIELIDLAISIDQTPSQVDLVKLPTCQCTKQKKMLLSALKGQCLWYKRNHSKQHFKLKNGFILCKQCYHQLHRFLFGDQIYVYQSEKQKEKKAWEYFQSQLYKCIDCLQAIQNLEEAQLIDENGYTRICKECIGKLKQAEKELERKKKNNYILKDEHINKEQNKITPFKEEVSSQLHKYRTPKPLSVPKQSVKTFSENRAQKIHANRQPYTFYYPIKILTPEPADEKQQKICQVCFKVISHERFAIQKQGITICFTCDRSNQIAQNVYLKQNKQIYRQSERFYSVKKRENRYDKEEQSKLLIKPALNHENYPAMNQAPEKKETKIQNPLKLRPSEVEFKRYPQQTNKEKLPQTNSQYKQDSKHFQGSESLKTQAQNINSQKLKQKQRFQGSSPQKIIQDDALQAKQVTDAKQCPKCLICTRDIVFAIDVGFMDGNTITCSKCSENQRQVLSLDKMSDNSKILQSNSKISRISDTNQQPSLTVSRRESSTSKNRSQINHLQPVSQRSQSSVQVIKSQKSEDIKHSEIKLINHNRSVNAQSQKSKSEQEQSVIKKSMFSNNDDSIEKMRIEEKSIIKRFQMREQKISSRQKPDVKENLQQSSLCKQQSLISKGKTFSDDKSIKSSIQQKQKKQDLSLSNSRLGSIKQPPVQIKQEQIQNVPQGSENYEDSGNLSHSYTRLLTPSLMQDSCQLKLDDSKMIPERDSSGQAPFQVEQTPILYKTNEGQSSKPGQKTVTQTQIKDVQCLITNMSSSGLSKNLEKDQLNVEKRKNDSFGCSMLLSNDKQENTEKYNKTTKGRQKPQKNTSQHSESIQPSQDKVQLQSFYTLLQKRHIQQMQDQNKIIENQKLDVDLKFQDKNPDSSEYFSCPNCQIFIGFGHGFALNDENEYLKNSDEDFSVFICKKCYYEQVLNEQEIKRVQLEDERRYAIYRSLDKTKNRIRQQGNSSRPQSVKKYPKVQQSEMNKKNTPNPYLTSKQQPFKLHETSQKPSSLQYQLSSFTQRKSFLQQKLDQRTQPSRAQFSRHFEISQATKSQLITSPSQPTTSILQPQQKPVKSQIPIQQPKKVCKQCKRQTKTICWTNECLDCFNRKPN